MSETKRIVVNTGLVSYELVNEKNEYIGTLEFVPSAVGIYERYKEVMEFFKNHKFEESTNDEADASEMIAFDKEIKNQFDYLLDTPSDAIFAKCTPTTLIANNKFFFAHALEVIGTILDETYKERMVIKKKNVAKAVNKYS